MLYVVCIVWVHHSVQYVALVRAEIMQAEQRLNHVISINSPISAWKCANQWNQLEYLLAGMRTCILCASHGTSSPAHGEVHGSPPCECAGMLLITDWPGQREPLKWSAICQQTWHTWQLSEQTTVDNGAKATVVAVRDVSWNRANTLPKLTAWRTGWDLSKFDWQLSMHCSFISIASYVHITAVQLFFFFNGNCALLQFMPYMLQPVWAVFK